MIIEWFIERSGTICSVLGGIVVTVGTCCMILLSSGVVVPVGVGIAIGAVAVGAVVSGACYLGHEHGVRTERERVQEKTESSRLIEVEELDQSENLYRNQYRAAKAARNSDDPSVSPAPDKNDTDERYAKMQADMSVQNAAINALKARVSTLEGAKAAQSHWASLRELHEERDRHPMQVDQGSDSDSEGTSLLAQHSIFPPQHLRHRQQSAANDSLGLGVEPRHRTSNHN